MCLCLDGECAQEEYEEDRPSKRRMKMRKRYRLGMGTIFLVLCLAIGSTGVGRVVNCWDCTGTANCTDEQADACRSELALADPEIWMCTGECMKSDAGGTVDICEPSNSDIWCFYDGTTACWGTLSTRPCETEAPPMTGSGSTCSGACTGSWSTESGGINNCT